MQKLIDFPDEQMKRIQAYADKECEGNASQAVRRLTTIGLCVYESDRKASAKEYMSNDNAR